MELRTTFPIVPSAVKINYQTPTVFIGSCFASEIGKQIEEAKFKVLINPSGTVYNPVSVANTLEFIIKNKSFMLTVGAVLHQHHLKLIGKAGFQLLQIKKNISLEKLLKYYLPAHSPVKCW